MPSQIKKDVGTCDVHVSSKHSSCTVTHTNHLYVGIAGGQITILCDQVNDLFYDDIIVMILELGHRFNEPGNLGVDARLESGTSKMIRHGLNLTRCHVVGRTENTTEDKGEVYDVAHHETDVLVAKQKIE